MRPLFCLKLLLLPYLCLAQPPVELNIHTRKFASPLPFDQPFDIVIKNADFTNYKNVTLAISPKSKNSDRWYFKTSYISNSKISGITRPDTKDTYFYSVRPLRANRMYNFSIEFTLDAKSIPGIDSELKKISTKSLTDLTKAGSDVVARQILDNATRELETYIQGIIPFHTTIKISLFSNPLSDFSNPYYTNLLQKSDAERNRDNSLVSLQKLIISIKNDSLEIDSSGIVDNNPSTIPLLTKLYQWKTNKDLNKATILNDIYTLKEADELPAIQSDSKDPFNTSVLPFIEVIIDKNSEFEQKTENLKKIIEQTIDLSKLFDDSNIVIEAAAEADFTSENSPYISYESGFGGRWDPTFTYYTGLVRFGALNITLLPNSKPHLLGGHFRWGAVVLKSWSFQAGLAKPLAGTLDPRIENSANTRSIMLGTGVKIFIFRLNYSGILYRVKDINPTINASRIKWISYPNVSISISIKSIANQLDNFLTN